MATLHSHRYIPHFTFTSLKTTSYKTPFLTSLRFRRHTMASAADTTETPNTGNSEATPDVLVQYVVLRRDLIDTWPLGSVVTQGCHASVAAIWSHKDDPHTVEYCSPLNIDSMHKVTLEVKGETQLKNLSEKLTSNNIAHKLWIEQPENYPTCLASKPYPKSIVSTFFKKLKLCRWCWCRCLCGVPTAPSSQTWSQSVSHQAHHNSKSPNSGGARDGEEGRGGCGAEVVGGTHGAHELQRDCIDNVLFPTLERYRQYHSGSATFVVTQVSLIQVPPLQSSQYVVFTGAESSKERYKN
ncbi:putative peptidyl-tRNA hydrolase PTRHD1 [Tanacetum coccineum]